MHTTVLVTEQAVSNRRFRLLFALAALALIAFFVFRFATTRGIGLVDDSTTYIGDARSLLREHGWMDTRYMPLYPAVLALFAGLLSTDPVAVASWLGAVLFAVNIFLVGLLVHMQARGSTLLPLLGAFLVLTYDGFLELSAEAHSEPLFVTFTLLSLLLLTSHLENPRLGKLLAGTACVAAAGLVRYQAVALCLAASFGLLLLSRELIAKKVRDAAICLTLGLLPSGLWVVRNAVVGGDPMGRQFGFHPLTISYLWTPLVALVELFLPEEFLRSVLLQLPLLVKASSGFTFLVGELGALVGLAAVLIAIGVKAATRLKRRDALQVAGRVLTPGASLLLIFTAGYVAVIVVMITFYDVDISMNFRTLVLAYVAAVMLGPRLVVAGLRSPALKRHERMILGASAAVLLASYPVRAAAWVWDAHTNGIGWNRTMWQDSAVLRQIKSLPNGLQIVTNGGVLVAVMADRPWKELPRKQEAMTGLPNSRYLTELAQLRLQLQEGQTVLAYFGGIRTASGREVPYFPSELELQEAVPPELVRPEADGWLAGGPSAE